MYGGIFGLPVVTTTNWGRLPLSFMLSFVALALGFPLGVVLALARSSKLPAIQVIAIIFIEVVRGVPLVSILFMASVMLPLFMPDGLTVDKLLQAQIAIIIFAGASIAETVRASLRDPNWQGIAVSRAMSSRRWSMPCSVTRWVPTAASSNAG